MAGFYQPWVTVFRSPLGLAAYVSRVPPAKIFSSASSVRVRTAHRWRSSKPAAGRKGRRRAIGAVPTGTSAIADVGIVEVAAVCIASTTVRPRARISIRRIAQFIDFTDAQLHGHFRASARELS